MNPDYKGSKMPTIKATPWPKVFANCKIDPLAIDLISKILVYSPEERLTPLEALAHPLFDELRNPKCRINSKPLENLFNFTEGMLYISLTRRVTFKCVLAEIGSNDECLQKLIPDWYVQQLTEAEN